MTSFPLVIENIIHDYRFQLEFSDKMNKVMRQLLWTRHEDKATYYYRSYGGGCNMLSYGSVNNSGYIMEHVGKYILQNHKVVD